MARVLKVVCALLVCVALAQPSYAFPSYRGCDPPPCCDCYDDCAECGYLRFPDEPLLPLQVIQGGPNCYRCKPLPYQVQVPLPPPVAPCGQQFGVRVEVPPPPPCKPCGLNVGYELETPFTPCLPKLPNLPVGLTVPLPQYQCHQPCHVNYELETPVAPCAPFLSNLKTQIDRVVLPCPCHAPITEGYVPKPEPVLGRRKRSVDWEESGCDCDDNDENVEDVDDDCVDDKSYSRCRRSPANWRPYSNSRRIEMFPVSRMDESPRSDWEMDYDDDLRDIEDREDDTEDYFYSEPVIRSPRFSRQQNGNGQSRVVGRELGPQGDEDRIVSQGSEDPEDDGRIVSQGVEDQEDEGKIVSEGLDQDEDNERFNGRVSSDPVGKRWQDPNFMYRQNPSWINEMDRLLLDSLMSSGRPEQKELDDFQQDSSGRYGGGTAIDKFHPAARTNNQRGRRIQSGRSSRSQQNSRAQETNEQASSNRSRLSSSGQNRKAPSQSGSQNRITTPNTSRAGGRQQGQEGPEEKNGSQGQNSGSQRMNRSQRQGSSQMAVGGSQQQRGNGSQQRKEEPQRVGGSQRQSGSQRQGSSGSRPQSNQQQRSPGQRTKNPDPRTRSGQINTLDRMKDVKKIPHKLVPDETIRFSDLIDYPGRLRLSATSAPPPIMPSSQQQRIPPPSSSLRTPQASLTPPSSPSQNSTDNAQPPQPPSSSDTSRVVTPTTYDQQPMPFYYDYDYYT